eukprot:COSAG02_NODE_18_length_54986_cov_345.599322_9_plen_38_part_00
MLLALVHSIPHVGLCMLPLPPPLLLLLLRLLLLLLTA